MANQKSGVAKTTSTMNLGAALARQGKKILLVVGEGKSYSLDTLTKATNIVLNGAKLIGTKSDISGPIEHGIAPAFRALSN